MISDEDFEAIGTKLGPSYVPFKKRYKLVMEIKAKIVVNELNKTAYGETMKASPVYSSDPNDPNKSFSDATPSGAIELFISNKNAHGFFKPGVKYLVTFVEENS